MIVILGAGIEQGGRDALGVHSDGLRQAVISGRRRVLRGGKYLGSEDESEQAQGYLLGRYPVQAQVRRIGFQEGFRVTPEGFGVIFIFG